MPISEKLLEILACPLTKVPVVQDGNWIVSTDPKTRRRYPIKDDIPVMLIEESEEMNENEWREVMKRHNREIPS
ncbi:MAG: Trm112 family protein [Candidatus Omnitrophota bacterium]